MKFTRSIASTPEDASALLSDAMDYLRTLQKNRIAVDVVEFDFRLALDEAMQNALSHGSGGDAGKRISVTITPQRKTVSITVCDEGGGFIVEDVPDTKSPERRFKPHGRGVCLLKGLYNARWEDNGRCVHIVV